MGSSSFAIFSPSLKIFMASGWNAFAMDSYVVFSSLMPLMAARVDGLIASSAIFSFSSAAAASAAWVLVGSAFSSAAALLYAVCAAAIACVGVLDLVERGDGERGERTDANGRRGKS